MYKLIKQMFTFGANCSVSFEVIEDDAIYDDGHVELEIVIKDTTGTQQILSLSKKDARQLKKIFENNNYIFKD